LFVFKEGYPSRSAANIEGRDKRSIPKPPTKSSNVERNDIPCISRRQNRLKALRSRLYRLSSPLIKTMNRGKTAAGILIFALVALLITPHTLDSSSAAESTTRGDALHFPTFLLLTLLIFFIFPSSRPTTFRITASSLIAIGLAIGTELIQSITPGRTSSLHDIFANLLGITSAVSGLFLWKNFPPLSFSWKKCLHAALTLTVAISLTWPYLQHLNARLSCQKEFPVLSDFHKPQFSLLWKIQNGAKANLIIPAKPSDPTTPSLEITLPGKNDFEGINYLPGAQDWSQYTTLNISLLNSGPPFLLGIRIDDDGDCSQLNARFNAQRLLKSGENHLTFSLEKVHQSPKHRELNLESIRRIALFTLRSDSPRKFSITRAWLE